MLTAALMESAPAAWYFLDSQKQPRGPLDAAGLSGLATAGTIWSDTLLWREGRSSWDRLEDIEDLAAVARLSSGPCAAVDAKVAAPPDDG